MLLLATLRGSIILYQGEELGLPQVEVPFERLQDPEAIANWPQTLSRDGARTPMPWQLGRAAARVSPPASRGCRSAKAHRALAVDRQAVASELAAAASHASASTCATRIRPFCRAR